MTIDRSQVEEIIVRRCGRLMISAGLNGSTVDGTNPDLTDPIGWALRILGGTPGSVSSVTDADLEFVTDDLIDPFLDLVEYRTVETIEGNYNDVDIQVLGRSEKLSQLVSQIQGKLNRLYPKVSAYLPQSSAPLTGGTIQLDFLEPEETL